MKDEKVPAGEAITNFNTYVTEFRARADNTIKQVLLVSGGIQTITIGAFLNGSTPKLPTISVPLLTYGWCLLSASIVLCLTFLIFQTIAQWHVSYKHAKKLAVGTQGMEVMNTWPAFRRVIWVVGILAFVSCIAGVYVVSKAAISLIASANGA